LIFVDVNEDLIMVDDVVTPSNPPIVPIEEEELEEALLDVNVSQRSHEEKPSKRVVHTRVDHSTYVNVSQRSHEEKPFRRVVCTRIDRSTYVNVSQ
jgi:hypothetical protein